MNKDPWWMDEEYKIGTMSSRLKAGTKCIYARHTDNGWEYAITHWFLADATLLFILRDGEMGYDERGG